MKKVLLMLLGVFLLATSASAAKVDKKNSSVSPKPTASVDKKTDDDQRKQTLVAQIQELQQQELRVLVLQQLLNENVSVLRQKETLFCDQQKLDVDKWRKGGYQVDINTGIFSDKPVQVKK